jgi:cell division initiation protein
MSLTPLDIRKMTFAQKLRGYDPKEVEDFLGLVAEELAGRLGEIARLEQENRGYRERLEEAVRRQHELHETLLHGQKLSKDMAENARREAGLMVREAEVTADNIVSQAIEQANRIESKISELRTMRRDLQLKFRNTLDLFQRILEAEMEDERTTATIRTLPRKRKSS